MKKVIYLSIFIILSCLALCTVASADTLTPVISYNNGATGIKWSPVSHASYYYVYYNDVYQQTIQYSSDIITLSFAGVPSGSTYIKAFDEHDQLIGTSNTLTFTGSDFDIFLDREFLNLSWSVQFNAYSYTFQYLNIVNNIWVDIATVQRTEVVLDDYDLVYNCYIRVVCHLRSGEDLISNIMWIPHAFKWDPDDTYDITVNSTPITIPDMTTPETYSLENQWGYHNDYLIAGVKYSKLYPYVIAAFSLLATFAIPAYIIFKLSV